MRLRSIAKIIIILSALNLGFAPTTKAEDIKDTIIGILSGLTCETQGIGDLLRSEFSHTCIPAPFFTFLVANIVAPLTYANTLLRLKINDEEMFPDACNRTKRADPDKPTISFALCSNIKLAGVRIESVALSVIAIAKAMITGDDPWTDIKNAWTIKKERYHNMFIDKKEGDWDIMFDIGVPPVIPWKIIKEKDRLCVATTTITFDWIAVGCKYIKEPFPKSIYASFMDLNSASDDSAAIKDPRSLTKCNATEGCYQRAYNNSKTGIVISSPLIECIKEMSVRLLVSRDVCSFEDINAVVGSVSRESSVLFQFQKNMHRTVTAFLTLYVILFGFKIVLTGDIPPTGELTTFVFKVIFVTYFSVGINITPYGSSDYDRLDGMIQWAFPLLLGGIDQIANWIMSASPSELCKFNASDYPDDLKGISLWDALDCRVSHYLGLDMIKTMIVENQARDHDFATFDFFNFSIPPYYYLLIPAVISGNMTLVSLALMYPLLVISVAAYLINATVVCMIAIVILGVLAPLFVPMLLFSYTREFFDAWVKLMISFLLQPMVAVTFIITMFSIYDAGFYGTCKYKFADVKSGDRHTKIFYIDNNWSNYKVDVGNDIDDAKGCRNSLGFMLNNPMAAFYDYSKEVVGDMVKPQNSTEEYMAQFAFLGAIAMSPALFFISPKIAFEKIKDLMLALITACFTLYLMYNFSAQLSEFAADMTEGISIGNAAIKPQTLFKAGMAALGAAGKAGKAASAMNARKALGGGVGDKASVGSAGDRVSTGGGAGGAGDRVSTGGGAGDRISTGSGSQSSGALSSSSQSSTSASGASQNQSGRGSSDQLPSSGARPTSDNIPGSSSGSSSSNTNNTPPPPQRDSTQAPTPQVERRPHVPMEKLDSTKVNEDLSKFFNDKDRNIDQSKLQGYSPAEFSRYVAFSSDSSNEKKSDVVREPYKAMLSQTFANESMKGHEADFVNKIESMFSGTQLEKMKKINDDVLRKEGVARKPLTTQRTPTQGSGSEN